MGCTPSIHVNPSGVVYCKGTDESPSNQSGSLDDHYQLAGVQGNFKTADTLGLEPRRDSTVSYQNGPYEEERLHGSAFFQRFGNGTEEKEAALRFGPMCLKLPTIKVLLVFAKDDAQSDALKWAAEKLKCACMVAYNADEALETYKTHHHHLIFIDCRHTKTLDPISVSRSLHTIPGCQYSCLVAVVKKNIAEKEEASIVKYLSCGFMRWFVESSNFTMCLNEMIQIHHTDVSVQIKLQASQALFMALDNCKDGVIITGTDHDIEYVNKSSENLLGFSAQDMTGKNAQELCRAESVKADIVESINMQVKKGKEWEGTLFHKRKSGESIPLWSRILPVETCFCGPEHLVHVNEYPFNGDKHYASDTSGTLSDLVPYGYKPARKTSCDVRSLCSETGLNRRQSFAKFHPMTLEPPITKVINMILATQEHSPLFVVQALDRVLDILRSTELYSPQFTGLHHNRADDQVASDLFSGLISNSKQVLRRFSHDTFRGIGLPTPTTVPTLTSAPAKVKSLLENITQWGCDIIELEKVSEKRPLIWVGMSLFSTFNGCSVLNCDESVLRNWLSLMESNYHPNPYHNSTHAADVLQATAYFLQKPRLKAILDPMDEIISLIAAIMHDLDHPGKNSAFLCNTGNELAILYNDVSVLESHHAALAFKLTTGSDKVNIFQNLHKDTYKDVRHSVIDMVLATEMTKHFEHLSKFVNVFTKSVESEDHDFNSQLGTSSSADIASMATPENVVLVKRMLIKCADVSNPARPLPLCKEWAYRIAEEYIAQTDEEKSKGLPIVMPAFDRSTCSIPKSQLGFIDYFVNDMFDAWDAFGDFPEPIQHIRENYDYWKDQQQLREQKQMRSASGDSSTS